MTKLHLHNGLTPQNLIKAGFGRQSEAKPIFRFRENLYKNIIFLSIKIDLTDDENQIEWYVIDGNTGLTYNTFYFTPNSCKDLVRENVHKVFNNVINELDKRGILYQEELI